MSLMVRGFLIPEGYFRGGSAFPLESKGEPVRGICAVGFFSGAFQPFLGHNLNISYPISDVIPLSGKWSCRYLPESQRRNLNQG